MERMIKLAERRNNKVIEELTLSEFKIKYSNQLISTINSYKRHMESKDVLKPFFMHSNKNYTSDFYSNLQWNFNSYSNFNFYIAQIY